MPDQPPNVEFARLDEERRRKRDALYALGRKIRPHVRSVLERLAEDATISLASGTAYRVARLSWTGCDADGNSCPCPEKGRC